MDILQVRHFLGSVSEEEDDREPAVAALSESALFIESSILISAAQATAAASWSSSDVFSAGSVGGSSCRSCAETTIGLGVENASLDGEDMCPIGVSGSVGEAGDGEGASITGLRLEGYCGWTKAGKGMSATTIVSPATGRLSIL